MMIARLCGNTKTVPRRDTIVPELALLPVLFEMLKRSLQTRVKLRL